MISVYIPTHNRRILLARAIQSVLEQDHKDFELIIVNDGSTDDTAEYLDEVRTRDERVRIINNNKSMGACKSRNLAIQSAQGEFVTGLDDDDYYRRDHLSTLLAEYQKHSIKNPAATVFSGILKKGVRGERVYTHQKTVVRQSDIYESNWVGNQVFTPRRVIVQAGLFDEEMPAWQDYELWMRLVAISGEMHCTGVPTYILDQTHPYERISQKRPDLLRTAYLRTCNKHYSNASVRDKLKLRINYHSYPQVPMTFLELKEYLSHGLIIKPLYYFLRKLISGTTVKS